MRKLLLFIVLLTTVGIFAQTPQAFKYQAVARDSSGEVLKNQNVSFQFSILQGNASGIDVYVETHNTTTSDFGIANLDIGNGTLVSGDFTAIDWGGDNYFFKVEMDEIGGANYMQMGVSRMMSVPYALHAATAEGDGNWMVSGDDMYSNVEGNVGVGNSNPEIPLDVFGYNGAVINGMVARFDSDETNYSRIVIDGANGADTQISFMNNGSSKWTIGNDASSNNSFTIRNGFGLFGTNDVFVIPANGQADLNLPLIGNQGGLTVGKKAAEASGQTFSIVRSIGAHSIDTRYVTGFWAQSFGAYNGIVKLGNIGLAGSNRDIVDFMSFGAGGTDWWDTHSKFSVNKYGNVGIGRFAAHKSPTAKLEIDGDGTYDLLKLNTASGQIAFIVESSGNVGIGSDSQPYKLVVNGNAAKPGGGEWLGWSDNKLKNIKENYTKGLDEIMQLQAVVYSYKENTPQNLPSDIEYFGFVAQEVQAVFPEAVNESKDGYLTLDMQAVNMAVFNALKQLKEQNDMLKTKNIELEKRIELLEN